MLLKQMNWMDVERYLEKEDRLVFVTGSTEQHAYLSVATDTLVAWEIAKTACEEEGVILAPALPYGVAPHWMAYPGTVSLDPRTYLDLIEQILRSFIRHGFKRIVVLNGHGGNEIAAKIIEAVTEDHPQVMIKYGGWWVGPRVTAFLEKEGGSPAGHAGWGESFSWINQVGPLPSGEKAAVDSTDFGGYRASRTAQESGERLDDGMGGGFYSKDETTMRAYFQAAVDDLLDVLRGEWG